MPVPDDYAASTATTGVVAVNGSTTGTIETSLDQDWFAITLTAGETYQFKSQGMSSGQGTLPSSFLQLLDHNGNSVNGLSGTFSGEAGVTYTATSTATYYLDIGPNGGPDDLGTYKVSVADLDHTAPTVTAALKNDTGSSSTDLVTKDGTLVGSGDADVIVHFTLDSTPISDTTTADAGGNWTFIPTGLSDSLDTFVVSETDEAGNTVTASLTFELDTVAPIDVIASVELNKTGSFTFTGTAEATSTVKMYDGSMLLGSTSSDSTGQWKFTTENLPSTAHNFTSTATDAAGNVGPSTGAAIYGTNG